MWTCFVKSQTCYNYKKPGGKKATNMRIRTLISGKEKTYKNYKVQFYDFLSMI